MKLNSYIQVKNIDGELYRTYSKIGYTNSKRTGHCPSCGKNIVIPCKDVSINTTMVTKVDEEERPSLYFTGEVKEIVDTDSVFFYTLEQDNDIYFIVPKKEQEGLDRIFVRKGYAMELAGDFEAVMINDSIVCPYCKKKIYYKSPKIVIYPNVERIDTSIMWRQQMSS